MHAIVWDIVLSVLIGLGGVLAALLGVYLIVGIVRATVQLLRGDFDKRRGERIYTSSQEPK